MPHMARFHLIQAAAYWARQHSPGWIVQCKTGEVYWFDATFWTQTPIINLLSKLHDKLEIGTWLHFDMEHCPEIPTA